MRRAHLIRLGWTQLAVLIGSIACLMAAVWIIEVNSWQELYVRKFALPLLQERYGFRVGQVAFRRGSTPYELPGIVSVTPGGTLDRMGVRAGDVPFEHHGHGFTAMYDALASAEEGHFARFDVVNGHQWNARDREDRFRTVVLHPAGAVMPVSLHWFVRDELPAPAGPSVLVTVPPADPDSAWATLWVRNRATAESTPLYSYDAPIEAGWSPDGSWIAVTDWGWKSNARCLLLDSRGTPPLDLARVRAAKEPAPAGADAIDCAVFGWVRGTSRLAVQMWTHDARGRQAFVDSLLFDASTHTFTRPIKEQ